MSAESGTAWRRANPERSREITRASYHRNREARLATQREKNRSKKAEIRARINAIKLAAGCADCGYAEHPAALDFDHVRGEKSFGIGVSIMRRWSLIEEEIAKCEVVCANCHRVRTHTRWRDQCMTDGGT